MKFYFNLAVLILMDLIMAMSARMAHNTGNNWYLVISIGAICFAGYLFIKLLNNKITAVLNLIWIGCGTVLITLAGYFIFGEKLTYTQGAGMLLIFGGLIMMEVFAEETEAAVACNSDVIEMESAEKPLI